MNGFKQLDQAVDAGLLQVSQVAVFHDNGIERLRPFLRSVLFGNFEQIFQGAAPELQFRAMQLTQLAAQYFFIQAGEARPAACPAAAEASSANYDRLTGAFKALQAENERLRTQSVTPQYYKNMVAIKQANEQIRTENFKLK